MLHTLALALSLAAPVPKTILPFSLRTDPLPKEYKFTDLANAALPKGEKGTVSLLAWETIEDDRPFAYTNALLLKKFDKADKEGNCYSLTLVYRHTKQTDWLHRSVEIPPVLRGQQLPRESDAFHFGSQDYAKPPTDKELAAFLKDVDWTPKLGRRELVLKGDERTVTTKLAGGGFDRDAWKTHFDRDPPVELFPELNVPRTERREEVSR